MSRKVLFFSLFLGAGFFLFLPSMATVLPTHADSTVQRVPDTLWTVPAKPKPSRLVNDLAHILTLQQIDTMEQELEAYQSQRGYQIVVVTIDSSSKVYQGYADLVLQQWQVGGKDQRGILILVDYRYKSIYIARGKGLPADVVAGSCNRIIINHMVGPFSHQEYYQGLQQAIVDLEVLIDPLSSLSLPSSPTGHFKIFPIVSGLILLVLLGFFLAWKRKKK
ncbi:MAG: TPM domain-containing protein [Chitinophagaceae bacterium]